MHFQHHKKISFFFAIYFFFWFHKFSHTMQTQILHFTPFFLYFASSLSFTPSRSSFFVLLFNCNLLRSWFSTKKHSQTYKFPIYNIELFNEKLCSQFMKSFLFSFSFFSMFFFCCCYLICCTLLPMPQIFNILFSVPLKISNMEAKKYE